MNTHLTHRPGLQMAPYSRKLFAICALLVAFSFSSFALPGDEISDVVKASFTKDFSNARIISYESSPNLTRLTFSMNDLVLNAFYSGNGELLAISRNIQVSQLPLSLILSIREDYKDYWITSIFEIRSNEEHAYYMTLENASAKLSLRSVDNSTWGVYNKRKKE